LIITIPSKLLRRKHRYQPEKLPPGMRTAIEIDRRTIVGNELHKFRGDLVEELGGADFLSPLQRQQLELCCQLKLRCLIMDQNFADSGGEVGPDQSRSYLGYSITLGRILRFLQLDAREAAKGSPPTLRDRRSLISVSKVANG
jgi:hypothetical protein